MAMAGDLCIELTADPLGRVTWWEAAQECAGRGRRLCRVAEYFHACTVGAVLGPFSEWSADLTIDPALSYCGGEPYKVKWALIYSPGTGGCNQDFSWAYATDYQCYGNTYPQSTLEFRCCLGGQTPGGTCQ